MLYTMVVQRVWNRIIKKADGVVEMEFLHFADYITQEVTLERPTSIVLKHRQYVCLS